MRSYKIHPTASGVNSDAMQSRTVRVQQGEPLGGSTVLTGNRGEARLFSRWAEVLAQAPRSEMVGGLAVVTVFPLMFAAIWIMMP